MCLFRKRTILSTRLLSILFIHISLQYLLIFSQVAALQDENNALRTKIEVLEEESMKKVIFTINNRTKDQEGGVHNQQ